MKASLRVDLPGSGQCVGKGEPDITAFVVGKIKVIATEWVIYPTWHPDQRRSLNIVADRRVRFRADNRSVA